MTQSHDQSVTHSHGRSVTHSHDQSVTQSHGRSVTQSHDQSVTQSHDRSVTTLQYCLSLTHSLTTVQYCLSRSQPVQYGIESCFYGRCFATGTAHGPPELENEGLDLQRNKDQYNVRTCARSEGDEHATGSVSTSFRTSSTAIGVSVQG